MRQGAGILFPSHSVKYLAPLRAQQLESSQFLLGLTRPLILIIYYDIGDLEGFESLPLITIIYRILSHFKT